MTVVYNDPADFADDQFAGFLDLYSDRLRGVPGGAVSHRRAEPIVAVVVGGGSGHYPAFRGRRIMIVRCPGSRCFRTSFATKRRFGCFRQSSRRTEIGFRQ